MHLIVTEGATVPALGHAAFVAPDFDATVRALEAAGFEVEEHRQLWGEKRSFVLAPGGHRVEIMAAPPPEPERLSGGRERGRRIYRGYQAGASADRGRSIAHPRALPGRDLHRRRAASCSPRTSPTSTGRSSR